MSRDSKVALFLLASFLGVLVWSLIQPRDLFTWWLEIFPALLGLSILVSTYRRFKFTLLAYLIPFVLCRLFLLSQSFQLPFTFSQFFRRCPFDKKSSSAAGGA